MTFKRAPAALPAILAALAACVGLALLSLAATQSVAAGFDRALLAFFAARRGPQADAFFLAVTWLGSSFVLMPAAITVVAALAARGRWAAAGLAGLTYFGASLTTWLLKLSIGRERPALFPSLPDVAPTDWSFPSGHATHAAAFALAAWLLLHERRSRWRWPAFVALGGLALLVGASRLHLQVHWPTDVLAGLLVAGFWAGVALIVTHRGVAPKEGT